MGFVEQLEHLSAASSHASCLSTCHWRWKCKSITASSLTSQATSYHHQRRSTRGPMPSKSGCKTRRSDGVIVPTFVGCRLFAFHLAMSTFSRTKAYCRLPHPAFSPWYASLPKPRKLSLALLVKRCPKQQHTERIYVLLTSPRRLFFVICALSTSIQFFLSAAEKPSLCACIAPT